MIEAATKTAEGLTDLFVAQIKLARLELSLDLRSVVRRLAWIALFLPLLIVGYVFAMVALSSFLTPHCGRIAAVGAVAGLQLAVAGVGLQRALSALRRTSILQRTSADLTVSVERTMAALSDGTRSSNARIT